MIKIENVDVYGWEAAIRGMRNPMNSWDKSDSRMTAIYRPDAPRLNYDGSVHDIVDGHWEYKSDSVFNAGFSSDGFIVGDNDLDLMKRLASAGSVHAKYRRMINVTLDVVAPLYWWKEFDTYKVGTVANSCSTMHKIHAKEFTMDDFSHENLCDFARMSLLETIMTLNKARNYYLEDKDKLWWWQMIQLLPSSYNQRRTIQLNYEVLVGMYRDRCGHKLDEWVKFCEWIRTLPLSEIITGEVSHCHT